MGGQASTDGEGSASHARFKPAAVAINVNADAGKVLRLADTVQRFVSRKKPHRAANAVNLLARL